VTFVGYGLSSVVPLGSAGLKRTVDIPLADLGDTQFFYLADGENTCFGDSGGAAFLKEGAVDVLIGATSFGDSECSQFGADTRIDAFAESVLKPFIDAEPLVEGACGLDGACDQGCGSPDPDCDLVGCGVGGGCNRECPELDPDCPDAACAQDNVCDDRCADLGDDLDCVCVTDSQCVEACGDLDADCRGCGVAPAGGASSGLALLALAFLAAALRGRQRAANGRR
jgi:MYXO-CTERM domain-containing protein